MATTAQFEEAQAFLLDAAEALLDAPDVPPTLDPAATALAFGRVPPLFTRLRTFPLVKACKCGRCFTVDAWRTLPYVGEQPGPTTLEMRNCICGSTLTIDKEQSPHGRVLTLDAGSQVFRTTVASISADARVTPAEARRSISYVLEKLREGVVSAWLDLMQQVPAGHVRIYDTRGRASVRRLGKPLECIVPYEACSPIEGTPLRFHVTTGGYSIRENGLTDAAIMIWHGPERGTLRLRRMASNTTPVPNEDTLRLTVARGYDTPIPHHKP